MARTLAELPKGSRITDFISLGVIGRTFPIEKVNEVLERAGKSSQRQRDLPAHVVVYYVVSLALYMQVSYREVLRCLLEGLAWLKGPGKEVKVAGKSGISQARTRLGYGLVKELHDELVRPIARSDTKGAWYRKWRLVTLDGSTLETADNKENEKAFGRQEVGRGKSGYPQLRFVSVVENGTHVLFGTEMADYHTGEATLAKEVIPHLAPGMLCLADRNFFGYELWRKAHGTGADLLWRVRKNLILPCQERLSDGSYLSRIYPSERDRRHDTRGEVVRVVEYPDLSGLTTILNHGEAPAHELAALYHQRWEIETALDELKTHLKGARIQLRSKTPGLVIQEFYGLMMAHFAIRGLMHEAALRGDADPDELSFLHTVRVIRRKLPYFAVFPPSGLEGAT